METAWMQGCFRMKKWMRGHPGSADSSYGVGGHRARRRRLSQTLWLFAPIILRTE